MVHRIVQMTGKAVLYKKSSEAQNFQKQLFELEKLSHEKKKAILKVGYYYQ